MSIRKFEILIFIVFKTFVFFKKKNTGGNHVQYEDA